MVFLVVFLWGVFVVVCQDQIKTLQHEGKYSQIQLMLITVAAHDPLNGRAGTNLFPKYTDFTLKKAKLEIDK